MKSFSVITLMVMMLLLAGCVDVTDNYPSYIHPVAYPLDASYVTETSATLNGSVQPNSDTTKIAFIMSTVVDSVHYQTAPLIKAEPESFLPGNKWYPTLARVTGLKPKTTYFYAIVILKDQSCYGYTSFTTK